jgi:hypothetical protein
MKEKGKPNESKHTQSEELTFSLPMEDPLTDMLGPPSVAEFRFFSDFEIFAYI